MEDTMDDIKEHLDGTVNRKQFSSVGGRHVAGPIAPPAPEQAAFDYSAPMKRPNQPSYYSPRPQRDPQAPTADENVGPKVEVVDPTEGPQRRAKRPGKGGRYNL